MGVSRSRVRHPKPRFARTVAGFASPIQDLIREATAWWDTRTKPCASSATAPLLDVTGNGHHLHAGSTRRAFIADGVLHLPGTTGNYGNIVGFSQPLTTGDAEFEFWGTADWTNDVSMIAQWGGGGSRSFWFAWRGDGRIRLYYSSDGLGLLSATSTVAQSTPNGQRGRWKAEYDTVNNEIRFYEWTGSAWSQVGVAVPVTISALFDTPKSIEIGTTSDGAQFFYTGRVERAIVRNGIGGTIVLDADFNRADYTQSFALPQGGTLTVEESAADTNTPVWLPICGQSRVEFPGTPENYASTDASPAFDITGDLDLRAWMANITLAPSSLGFVVAKDDRAAQRSYYLAIQTDASGDAFLRLTVFTGGGGSNPRLSTVPLPSGFSGWFRVALDVDDGSGNHVTTFYTSQDGATWDVLGTPVVNTGVLPVIDVSTVGLSLGSSWVGDSNVGGALFAAQVWDGIEEQSGTKVFDVDFRQLALYPNPDLSEVEALTAQPVKITRSLTGYKSAVVYGRSLYSLGVDDFLEADDAPGLDFAAGEDFTLILAWREYATLQGAVKFAKYTGGNVGYRMRDGGGNFIFEPADGTNFPSVNGPPLASVLGTLTTVASTRRAGTALFTTLAGTKIGPVADTSLDLTNAVGLRVGAQATGSFSNMEFFGAAVFRRVLTDEEIALIDAHFAQAVYATGSGFSSGFSSGFR